MCFLTHLIFFFRIEAKSILQAAAVHGLTGKEFVWLVTKTVVGVSTENLAIPDPQDEYPIGMIGILIYQRSEALFFHQMQ